MVRFLFMLMLVTLLVYVPSSRFIVSPLLAFTMVWPRLSVFVMLVSAALVVDIVIINRRNIKIVISIFLLIIFLIFSPPYLS